MTRTGSPIAVLVLIAPDSVWLSARSRLTRRVRLGCRRSGRCPSPPKMMPSRRFAAARDPFARSAPRLLPRVTPAAKPSLAARATEPSPDEAGATGRDNGEHPCLPLWHRTPDAHSCKHKEQDPANYEDRPTQHTTGRHGDIRQQWATTTQVAQPHFASAPSPIWTFEVRASWPDQTGQPSRVGGYGSAAPWSNHPGGNRPWIPQQLDRQSRPAFHRDSVRHAVTPRTE